MGGVGVGGAKSNNYHRATKTSRLGYYSTFTMVGQLRIHVIRKRLGIISYLCRQNKGRWTRAVGSIPTYNLQHGLVILEKKMIA